MIWSWICLLKHGHCGYDCAWIASTMSGLNVPKWIIVFRYLVCLQFIAYLLFPAWESMLSFSTIWCGPGPQTVPRSENYDLRARSQIDESKTSKVTNTFTHLGPKARYCWHDRHMNRVHNANGQGKTFRNQPCNQIFVTSQTGGLVFGTLGTIPYRLQTISSILGCKRIPIP